MSSSSSSSSSSQYKAPKGSWNQKIQIADLDGLYWFRRAVTGLYGLWLFMLIGIAISTIFVRRSKNEIFRVQRIWLPMGLAIVYYAFTFANQLVELYASDVTYAYILAQIIISSCIYLAEIAMLALIFRLLFVLLRRPHHGWLVVHYVFCGFLCLVYLAIFGLKVRLLYEEVYGGDYRVYYYHGRPISSVLDVFYAALYAIAALEIPGLVIHLIASPLLFSRLYTLGYEVAYEITYINYEFINSTIAFVIIQGLAMVLIFGGFVAIAQQSVNTSHLSDLEDRAMQQGGHHAPSHVAMTNEPYSHEYGSHRSPSEERLVAPEGGLAEWKSRVTNWRPSFRKGGKSGLGLKTAF